MLKVTDINFSIGKKQILKDVCLEFLPGQFNMILGPNGSGKSTFLKILSGELQGYSGEILYGNKKLESIKKAELAKFRAVMSQQSELSFPLSVDEVVMMGRYPHFGFHPTKKDEIICKEVMAKMNIESFSDRNYLTLSGGEKQRVQYARVLAQIWEPPAIGYRYLFLDEPLTSLDINYQQEFLQIAREFTKDHTILLAVMHDINLALQFASQLYFFKEGALAASGPASQILSADLIKSIFGVDVLIMDNPATKKQLVVFVN
jgi:iron complex transport system ATP-binding protein